MEPIPLKGAQVKVTVHEAVIASGEDRLLSKAAFTKLVDLLRSYPSYGCPAMSPERGVIRLFPFDGIEIVTQRLTQDELQILGMRGLSV
jgi:hypothetical protein